jgi:type VI protein secretion system component Hcp
MAIDAYMFFVPGDNDPCNIEGETADELQKGVKAFEITDFKWGASSASRDSITEPTEKEKEEQKAKKKAGRSAGVRIGTIHVDAFSITKPFDTASLGLFQACTTKDAEFALAKVIFRKMKNDGNPFVYLRFEFTGVKVDKIEWKIKALESSDKPDEEDVDFSFLTCNIFYTPQSKKGDAKTTKSYTFPSGNEE